MSGAQATTPAVADATTTEGVNLLEQVLGATKQTERDRAQDLVKTLVEEALTGTVTQQRGQCQCAPNLKPNDRRDV